MTTKLTVTFSIILTSFLVVRTFAQNVGTKDFSAAMRNYDFSTILLADSILVEDAEAGREKIKRAEILGFIGDDYQRLYIHFVSMIQNPTNPYQYLVYGKTKVR